MKKLLLTAGLLTMSTSLLFAQKYMTRSGKISFDATTSTSPEKIAGINNEVAGILDGSNGHLVFQALIKSFKFEKELMMEHFNENYMESDKFAKSDFVGDITNFSEINLKKDGSYDAKVSGKLTIHGVTNNINTTGKLVVAGNKLKISAKMGAKLIDYKIVVPTLVGDKVAKEATFSIDAELTQK